MNAKILSVLLFSLYLGVGLETSYAIDVLCAPICKITVATAVLVILAVLFFGVLYSMASFIFPSRLENKFGMSIVTGLGVGSGMYVINRIFSLIS